MNKVTTPRASTRRTAAIDLDDAAKTDKVAAVPETLDFGDSMLIDVHLCTLWASLLPDL